MDVSLGVPPDSQQEGAWTASRVIPATQLTLPRRLSDLAPAQRIARILAGGIPFVAVLLFEVLATDRGGWLALLVSLLLVALAAATRRPDHETKLRDRVRGLRRRSRRGERAQIGADGIALEGGRFIAYRDVATFERDREWLLFTLAKGDEPIVLEVASEDRHSAEEVIQRGRSSTARAPALEESGGYRAPPLDRERAWSVARDPQAPPSARVAACTLLRVEGGVAPDDRRALDAARDATANPHVRIALDTLVPDADDADALDDGDAAGDRARRS